ncbi:MAG: hypothetical protein QW270_01060 [Candidatus Bathyarchaeia archaeon]
MKVWLDVALLQCPNCGRYYVDVSWYVIELELDIQCGQCGKEFNSKKNVKDRVMLEFQTEDNSLCEAKILEHLKMKE